MQLQRRSILKLLFILYFSLYVISPLCYTEDELGKNQITPSSEKDIINEMDMRLTSITLPVFASVEKQADSAGYQ